ncbi:MAG: PHP domain-containing protein [Hydrogenovibrio sp.]|nr:PHP domain-containing protein [Hydrogenovibrio sp.]
MRTFKPDFHCHTSVSDGALPPEQLIDLAVENAITHLAITDHDTTAGYESVVDYAQQQGICLISGSEISCQWNGHTIHVVGLEIDVDNAELQAGLKSNRVKRWLRAFEIDDKAKKRFSSLLETILPELESGMIGRNHFAQELIKRGIVKDQQKAFDKFLKKGRPMYVPVEWPDLTEVVQWILGAGGIAVIAHPHIYKMGSNNLNRMFQAFKDAGGQAIEVVNQPRVCSDQIGMADRARRHGLYASIGSDFHRPEHTWRGLGWLSEMPEGVDPVWNHFKQPV